jgi:hypothetical protein
MTATPRSLSLLHKQGYDAAVVKKCLSFAAVRNMSEFYHWGLLNFSNQPGSARPEPFWESKPWKSQQRIEKFCTSTGVLQSLNRPHIIQSFGRAPYVNPTKLWLAANAMLNNWSGSERRVRLADGGETQMDE